ncbi:MAG: hypothetical protein V1854_06735, partial [Methanobacteriota archaeon]
EYFNYLEKGRQSDVSDFVSFIIDEHKNILPERKYQSKLIQVMNGTTENINIAIKRHRKPQY